MEANPLRRALHLLTAFGLVLSQLMLLAPSTAYGAPIVVVNSTGDTGDDIPGDRLCDTGTDLVDGSNECTLRAALEEANATNQVNQIDFAIPATDPFYNGGSPVITVPTALPWIDRSVEINGTSQPGYAGSPLVTLDGTPASGDVDGLLISGDASTIRALVVRNFPDDGIEIHGDRNTILGNHVYGNHEGVLIERGTSNVVGGTAAGGRNVIASNRANGISVDAGHRTEIYGNYIGITPAGDSTSSNAGDGIHIWNGTDRIQVGPGNVVSGNDDGIAVVDGSRRVTIESNLIGPDATGTLALGNRRNGVFVDRAFDVTIGPTNVISANSGHGVRSEHHADQLTIVGNRIGTDATGSSPLPNGGDGAMVDTDSADIIDNQISANTGNGLTIEHRAITVRGNLIGTDSTGSGDLGNAGHGIVTGSGTTGSDIGGNGAGHGNTIAFNGGDGVSLRHHGGTQAAIVGNSIHSNGGLGINLPQSPGPNPNDAGDGDGGPNEGLNYPEIVLAEETTGTVNVDFSMDVESNGRYLVQFFTNPSGVDPSGYGEGEHLVASLPISVSDTSLDFSLTFPGTAGDQLTATATRCTNFDCTAFSSTSEFSPVYPVGIGNHAPTIAPIGTIYVDETSTLSYTPSASDVDGDDLTFDLVTGPAGLSVDPDTGELTWTLSETHGPGSYPFQIRATDDGSPVNLSTTADGTISVAEVNQAPILGHIGDRSIPESSPFTFTATAIDADLPANTLTFGLGGPAPAGASINPSSGVFSWTPTEVQGPGSYTFEVSVDDGTETDSEWITIDVAEVNTAPVVSAVSDQSNAEGDTVSLPIVANDDDIPSNTLEYSATGLPPGLGIDAGSGVISGSIAFHAASASPYSVVVAVEDEHGASDSISFTWLTDNTNRPPSLLPIANQVIDEENRLTFRATATDPDSGSIFTFRLLGAPAGATIDPATGRFSWTPTENQGPAVYHFEVAVTDNGSPTPLRATRTVTVRVRESNEAPSLSIPTSLTIAELSRLRFTASGNDTDWPANQLTFSLGAAAPAGADLHPTSGRFTWTPTESHGPGSYSFPVMVRDDSGATATRHITVHVTEVNQAPTIVNPGPQTHAEDEPVDLAIAASDADLPANDLAFTASGLPPGLTIDPLSGTISGIVGFEASDRSPYTTRVTVHDSAGASASTAFTWDTANTNRAPSLDAVASRKVDELSPVSFRVTATDPDPGTTFSFEMLGAPAGASLDPATGVFSWTPNERQGPNTYTFEIGVTDGGTPALDDAVEVTIEVDEVNTPPVVVADEVTTAEDTPVGVAVLSNDSDVDYPANRLGIVAIDQPVQGGFAQAVGSDLEYQPPANFHGVVDITYQVDDGTDRVDATLTVTVRSVNDAPISSSDRYRLVTYQPAVLDVLHNDSDVDGDPLGISLVTFPDVGTARIEDNQIVYDPQNGWTGTVEFEYRVRDPHGAADTASVRVVVGDEVLIGARTLADDLGNEAVTFQNPTPNFDPATLSLVNLDGITLLADSFFQTVSALRVPLGFLGVTVAMVVGFGASSGVPALVFGTQRRHWAVVRLGRQQRLPAYSEPGGRKVVYNYDPAAAGIVTSGVTRRVGNTQWLPVETPNGPGWVYRSYLTEQVDLQAFADDPRPVKLVHELAKRLRTGKNIGPLISDQGLVVALTGSPNQIAPDEIAEIMGGKRLHHIPGIGKTPNTPHEFTVAVANPFLEAYDGTPEITAETPHSRNALIPTECWNFPYLALGTRGSRQPWLVFFEYRNGRAWIAGLGIDE